MGVGFESGARIKNIWSRPESHTTSIKFGLANHNVSLSVGTTIKLPLKVAQKLVFALPVLSKYIKVRSKFRRRDVEPLSTVQALNGSPSTQYRLDNVHRLARSILLNIVWLDPHT